MWCGIPMCNVLILVTAGAAATNRCAEHTGVKCKVETDAQRVERVRVAMGWAVPRWRAK